MKSSLSRWSSRLPVLRNRPRAALALVLGLALGLALLAAGLLWVRDRSGTGTIEWAYAYDSEGRLERAVDPAGREVAYRYATAEDGGLRRVEKRLASGRRVVVRYDAHGRREALEDETGETRFRWDGFDRLVAVRWPDGVELRRTYDTLGRLSAVEIAGESLRFDYDHLGRLERLSSPAGEIVYTHRPAEGIRARTLPNGVRTVWSYRPDGSLESVDHVLPDGRPVGRFLYEYGDAGRIVAVREEAPAGTRTVRYGYDPAGRLATVSDSRLGEVTYRHDLLGNRTERVGPDGATASAYDEAGRLTEWAGMPVAHDRAGNLAALPGPGGDRSFAYDDESRLVAVSAAGAEVRYLRDGDGQPASRSDASGETRFYADPDREVWRPWMAVDGGGRSSLYLWEGDVPLASISGGRVRYFLADSLGSSRIVVDEGGAVVERRDYLPFGAPAPGTPPGDALAPGFAGLFYDASAGLYLTRARAYDPSLGRFLQREPAPPIPPRGAADLAVYLYGAGDPVSSRDASGLSPTPPPYDPGAYRWWHSTWDLYRRMWVPLPPPDAVDRFLDVLSHYPNVSWADEGHRAAAQGRQGEAYFYYGLEATGHAGNLTPVIDTTTRRLYTVGFDPDATPTARAWAVAGLAWDLGGSPALRYGGSTILANAAKIPNSAVYQALLRQGNTLLTLADLVSAWGMASTVYDVGQAVPDVIEAWSGDDRRTGFDGGPPGGGPPGTGGPGTGGGDLPGMPPPLLPSTVGGIYLEGAGEALGALGNLAGVAVDPETGRLVLLATDGAETALPPLRLADLATVFRSVYERGEAPFVSIDPDPGDPRGPRMLVRHGELTADTYVGWVLFETDRLMKAYSLGVDNVTGQGVESGVEGYRDLLDLGFSGAEAGSGRPVWERFWIVPARVERARAGQGELTLLDVPLQVKTQRMVLRGGRLEPAPEASPSAEAEAFATWFTRRYGEIAREARSVPPDGAGASGPVAVFAELQRVALMTAVAEALRDQGVPAPPWLGQVEVPPVAVTPTTPAITVEAAGTDSRALAGGEVQTVERRLRIYGGVDLSPPSDAVLTVPPPPGGAELAAQLLAEARAATPLSPFAVERDGRRYTGLALPGAGSREVGAQRLAAVDLDVPVGAGGRLRLVRRFHSFFRQSGPLGTSWTLDLPRLESGRRPVRRIGDEVHYREVPRLTSPLGTVSAAFTERRRVPELGIETLAPMEAPDVLGLVSGDDRRIGLPTRTVVFRDGRRWHFAPSGELLARERRPLLEVLRRDEAGCLRRIEGWLGEDLRADVRLECDARGRLRSARGSDGTEVRYSFDATGCLTRVEGPGETVWEYECDGSQVTRIARDGRDLARYEYGPGGTLVRWRAGDGPAVRVERRATEAGLEVETVGLDGQGGERILYDPALRPLRWEGRGGHGIRWRYPEGGGVETVERLPQGDEVAWRRSADGDGESWTLPAGGRIDARLDGAGRVVELSRGERVVGRQHWTADGRLAGAELESATLRLRYREDGVLEGLQVLSPDGGAGGRWLELAYDGLGRVVGLRDGTGLEVRVGHGAHGPEAVASGRGWARLQRDDDGRVTSVETSWGLTERHEYDPGTGALRRTEVQRGSERAVVELEDGRPVRVEGSGGTRYRARYEGGRPVEVEGPEGLGLAYEYSADGRVTAVARSDGGRIEYRYDDAGRLTGVSHLPAEGSSHPDRGGDAP